MGEQATRKPIVCAIGFGFLQNLMEGYCEWMPTGEGADFVLTMNNLDQSVVEDARREATRWGVPLAWWSIEDPNSCGAYGGNGFSQPAMADFVFTSDKACIPTYKQRTGNSRIYWLPLAANEWLHRPLPLLEGAADFVFSGNWYDHRWEARRWGTETVILPLARAGHSMAIHSNEPPLDQELQQWWVPNVAANAHLVDTVYADRVQPGYYTAVAEQYQWGKVVLGNNNQRSGLDGREHTYMCSMRVFEALACGKSFLSPWSEAYEALGLRRYDHLLWIDKAEDAVPLAQAMLIDFASEGQWGGPEDTQAIAERGRAFVLANHTYGHRLARIAAAIAGTAEPEDWR